MLDEVKNTPWGKRVEEDIIFIKTEIKIVKDNTQWIVDVIKGIRASGPVIGWIVVTLAGVVTMIVGVATLLHGSK